MQRGDYRTLMVTDSSRLDRREDLDAQAEILLAIRSAAGTSCRSVSRSSGVPTSPVVS
jgi:hypothetical protein